MNKKVVVLRKINGLWRDIGERYEPGSEKNQKAGTIFIRETTGRIRQADTISGSLHLVA